MFDGHLAKHETQTDQIKYVLYSMPRTPYYGLVVQNGPYSVSKYRNQKDHYWQGGGIPAGGRQHAGHANWLQVMQYPTRAAYQSKGLPKAKALPEPTDWDSVITLSPHEYALKLSRGVLGNRQLRKFTGRRSDQPPEWFKKFVDTLMPGQMPNDNGQVGQPITLPPAPPSAPGGGGTIDGLPGVQDIPQMTEGGMPMDLSEGGMPMDMSEAYTDNFVDEVERAQHLIVQPVNLVPLAAIEKASSPASMISESSAGESSPEGSIYYTPTREIVIGTPSKEPRIDQTLINQTAAQMGSSMARPEESNAPSSFQTPQRSERGTSALTPESRKSPNGTQWQLRWGDMRTWTTYGGKKYKKAVASGEIKSFEPPIPSPTLTRQGTRRK